MPRPSANATDIEWGGGSCFINAGLQFLFSSVLVQKSLAEWVSDKADDVLRRSRSSGNDLWSLCTLSSFSQLRREPLRSAKSWEIHIALTFAAALQGESCTGESLRGRPVIPAMLLRACYSGRQEDSSLFVMNCIDKCMSIKQLFRGEFDPAELYCQQCRVRVLAGAHADETKFVSLQIQCRCHVTDQPYCEVQQES